MSPDGTSALQIYDEEETPRRFTEVAADLAAPRQVLETAFVSMGGKLAECSGILRDVSTAHKALSEDMKEEAFTETEARIDTVREMVEQMGTLHASQQGRMETLSEMAAAINAPLADLARTVKTIGIVAINARIASAETDVGADSAATFTLGMAKLALDTGEVVASFRRAHDTLTGFLKQAQAVNVAFEADHGDTIRKIPDRLAGHMETTKANRAKAAANMTERTRQLTDQAAGRVASAVLSLQIGDITRQRIEHVEETFDALNAVQGIGSKGYSVICRLQADQLAEATSDFDREIGNLEVSFRELARDSEEILDANCREAWSLARMGGSALAAVSIQLEEVRGVLGDYQGVRESLDTVAESVVTSVSEMVGYLDSIREIEEDMRLLSLNTVIQCGHFGRGGVVLKAIAQELRKLTEQTVTNAETIIRALNEASEASRALAEDVASYDTAKIGAFLSEISDAKSEFDAAVAGLEASAEQIDGMKPRALELLNEAVTDVVVRDEFIPTLNRTREDISAMVGDCTDGVSEIDPDYAAAMRARYTMDSERLLHDAVFGAPPGGEADESGAEADDMDDIFF